jgi:hypothetical protein
MYHSLLTSQFITRQWHHKISLEFYRGTKERTMQRARWRARHRHERETNDAASGTADIASAAQRKDRYREGRSGQVVRKRKKRTIQRAARRVRGWQEKKTSDRATSVADVAVAAEKHKSCCERRGGQGVEKRKKRAIQRATLRARGSPVRKTSDTASGAVDKRLTG